MAKYSTFKYGDGTKYGTHTANLRWGFAIAWDGQYGWGDEAEKMVSVNVRRGRRNLIAAGGRGLQAFPPGEATVVLDNEDGRYDPYNTDSPLYPHVAPGKFARLKVADIDADGSYELMRGVVKDIQPVKQGGKQMVRIVVIDGLRWLMDRMINISRTEGAVKSSPPGTILTRADWPDEVPELYEWLWAITAVTDTQDYWWAWNQNAYEIMKEWSDSIAATFFHSRDGDLKWRPRTYEYLRNTIIHEEEVLEDISRAQPWEVIRNAVRVNVYTKKVNTGPYTLWELGDIPYMPALGTLFFEAVFKYEEWSPSIKSMIDPPTFTFNRQADGGGLDLTTACNIRWGLTISEGITLWITNESPFDGYITALSIRGAAVYAPDVTVKEASDRPSKELYGPRNLVIDSRWTEDSNDAQDMADWLLSELKDPGVYPVIQLEDRPEKQFVPDLYDSIVLHIDAIGISHEQFRVGAIEHQTIGESCQGVRTTFYLEPYMRDGDPESYQGCRVYAAGNVGINTAAASLLPWSQETHDAGGYHSQVANTSRITIPSGGDGYYRIYAQIKWENNTAAGYRELRIRKNGATYLTRRIHDAAPVTSNLHQHVEDAHLLAAGDYLQVIVYQNSGVAVDIENGSSGIYSFFGVDKIP